MVQSKQNNQGYKEAPDNSGMKILIGNKCISVSCDL